VRGAEWYLRYFFKIGIHDQRRRRLSTVYSLQCTHSHEKSTREIDGKAAVRVVEHVSKLCGETAHRRTGRRDGRKKGMYDVIK
jgi:hypothetical protein